MARFSESARQREFFRYYSPIKESGAIKTAVRGNDPAHSSSDTALTAFAQLGALRLNAARCIISLVGAKREYVLAEASQTLSLQDDHRYGTGDELWHGSGELKTRAEVGVVLTELLADHPESPVSHIAVEDLQLDDRFKHLPMVVDPPYIRSLVCLPLRTPRAYVIGLYCIVDNKPRPALKDAELQVLRDMATTTMNHLEAARVKQRHHRSEKMIKALALFLEGHDSLRNWWLNQATDGSNVQQGRINESYRRGVLLEEQADLAFGVQDGPDRISRATIDNLQDGLNFQRDPSQSPSVATPGDQNANPFDVGRAKSVDFETVVTHRPKVPPISQSLTSGSPTLDTQGTSIASGSTRQPRLGFLPGQDSNHLPGKELQEALLSADLKSTFSRASNLLREAIDLDGAAFFDASIGSFGAGSDRTGMNQKAPGAHTFDSIPETTTSESDGGFRIDTGEKGQETSSSPATVMGYSTRTRSSLKNHLDSDKLGAFPDKLLRILAKRYPHGKVFNYDDDGSMSSSDIENQFSDTQYLSGQSTDVQARKEKKRLSKQAEGAAILKVIPGARSVGWFPLWDSMNERWYAGALIWTMSPTRVLTPEDELTYMAAWGNSIMAEVSRLAALVASRIKVDFVSSISHELRSPLHGILASVEFLQEAAGLPPLQTDMINTINSCGKTLLDTINHVLEFAKVHKKRSKKPKGRSRRGMQRPESSNTIFDDISNLSVLAEEVVDSVYAGRIMKRTLDSTSLRLSPVIVIIDLPRNADQNFKLNAGAFRRVLMNLFNNALKYTDSGFVRVSVTIYNESLSQSGTRQPILHLVISDSGKGISKEFIKNSLYRAFKQEDALSVGTGLGLSIVRRVLSDVGGRIDMESEVGSGTKAIVTMPMQVASNSTGTRGQMILETREKMKGLQACILTQGFNVYPNMSDEPTGILSAEAQGLIHLRASAASILEDWFEMEVKTSVDLLSNDSDVILTVLSDDFENEIQSMGRYHESGDLKRQCVIALCEAAYRDINFTTETGIQVYYLRLPVTPSKIGRILHDAFCGHQVESPEPTPQPATEGIKFETDTGLANTDTHTVQAALPIGNPSTNRRPSLGRKRTTSVKRSYTVPQEDSIDTSASKTDLQPGTQKTLLVEDNEINLRILEYAMKNLNQEYTTATNGLEAVEAYKAAKGDFDLVIIDVQMPVMDGLEATRQIRRYETQEELNPAAVVAMTGGASTSARQEAFSSGMDLFLTKPVKMSVLKELLIAIKTKGRDGLRDIA